ncbi:hypothetical protein BHM03_00052326 [Ensete ventricosum]|nr:hypothetical protein BHM03_00052326 [Ensete ventricosum]
MDVYYKSKKGKKTEKEVLEAEAAIAETELKLLLLPGLTCTETSLVFNLTWRRLPLAHPLPLELCLVGYRDLRMCSFLLSLTDLLLTPL